MLPDLHEPPDGLRDAKLLLAQGRKVLRRARRLLPYSVMAAFTAAAGCALMLLLTMWPWEGGITQAQGNWGMLCTVLCGGALYAALAWRRGLLENIETALRLIRRSRRQCRFHQSPG